MGPNRGLPRGQDPGQAMAQLEDALAAMAAAGQQARNAGHPQAGTEPFGRPDAGPLPAAEAEAACLFSGAQQKT